MSDSMRVTIHGPGSLWSAEAEIIEWMSGDGHFHDHRTVRNLLMSRRQKEFGGGVGVLPGTFVALCAFLQVTVKLAGKDHSWANEELSDRFKSYQSLLLLQADPDEWQSGNPFPECICLAGEIELDRFSTQSETWEEVFKPWDIDGKRTVSQPVAHSSGFSFRGAAKLPWRKDKKDSSIESLLWVSTEFPLPDEAPKDRLRLVSDFEAMKADDQFQPTIEQFKLAFAELAQILVQPIKFDRDGGKQDWQRWLFLDLVNKIGIPEFHWNYSPRSGVDPTFELERGEVQLLFADQPPGEKDVEQRSVLSSSVVARFETTNGLKILFDDGAIAMPFDLPQPPPIPNPLKDKLKIDANGRVVSWRTGALFDDKGQAFTRPLISDADAAALQAFIHTLLESSFRRALVRLLVELKTPAHVSYNLAVAAPAPAGGLTPAPTESIELVNLKSSYDAIETAALLRRQYSLPAPKVGKPVTQNSLLWGFMALEDGWAQLPFLNVTEQLYLDTSQRSAPAGQVEIETDDRPPEVPLLSGAATFGNDRSEFADTQSSSHSWDVILLDGSQYSGRMEFNSDMKLARAAFVVLQPDVALNGFLWLGLEAPSAADALPPIENWLTGLRPISLRSVDPGEQRPAPFVLNFPSLKIHNETEPVVAVSDQFFSAPTLDDWAFVYSANTDTHPVQIQSSVLRALLEKGLWAQLEASEIAELEKTFWQDLPLVWRRHPQMPLIQSLPLTQSRTPPNYPAKSRQLVPFQLNVGPPENNLPIPLQWSFGVPSKSGASSFPLLSSSSEATIAEQWLKQRGLRMAALGLPGLALGSNKAGLIKFEGDEELMKTFPPAQYFYGLPYTDELNALAQLPKGTDEKTSADKRETAPPPLALIRSMYAKFWADLSEKGELATAEVDRVLARGEVEPKQLRVENLVAPFVWNLNSVSVNAQAYPGSITLNAVAAPGIQLTGNTLLRGIHGNFNVNLQGELVALPENEHDGKYQIIAESLKSVIEDGRVRDQAGSLRAPTRSLPNQMLSTELVRKTKDGSISPDAIKLLSRLGSYDLEVDGATTWSLWFRDLPVFEDQNQFERQRTLVKETAEDINDPSARSGDRVHLTGYEWRLGQKNAPSIRDFLPLFGFDFYPLRFESAVFDSASSLKSIEIIGRLQLPTMTKEVPELGNAVRVTFATVGDRLKLKSIHTEPMLEIPGNTTPKGYWQLSETSSHHPQLSWQKFDYDSKDFMPDKNDGVLKITGALDFFLFGGRSVLTGDLRFTPGQSADREFQFDPAQFSSADTPAVRLSKARLTFTAALSPKEISAEILFLWGQSTDPKKVAPVRVEAVAKIDLKASDRVDTAGGLQASLTAALLYSNSERVPLLTSAFSLVNGGLQFGIKSLGPELKTLQLLPGMEVEPGNFQGFAAAAFSVNEKETALSKRLSFSSGFVELIIPCAWGRSFSPGLPPSPLPGSSSGSLFAGLTLAGSAANSWTAKLLLNGSLEINNLISWPAQKRLPDELKMVRFEGNSSKDIIDADSSIIEKVAKFLSAEENRDINLRLEGHTDSEGKYQDNLRVSKNRAENVRKALKEDHKIDKSRIKIAIGFSSTLPIDSNDDFEGKQNNRRVEFVVDQVVLPAAHPGALKPPLNHLRHTLTVLLNQHEVPADLLGPGGDALLFNFKKDNSWQFLAATQHRLVDVTQTGDGYVMSNERRWTVMQEVRLVNPGRFETFLKDLKDVLTINPTTNRTQAKPLPEVSYGYLHKELLELLLKEVHDKADELKQTLFVEASSAQWILPEAKSRTDFTNLQYLPNGIQRAILSSPQDFAMRDVHRSKAEKDVRTPPEQELWLLLQLPFLGRLQNIGLDVGPPKWLLQRDPILNLDEARKQNQTLEKVWLSFASMADNKSIRISLSDFDYSGFRRWRRLDPATLQESWFRMQHPVPEIPDTTLTSVMSALPSDSPGRLSRATLLNRLFDEFRGAFPPSPPLKTAPKPTQPPSDATLTWRRDNLFTLQGFEREGEDGVNDTNKFYGFHLVAAQLHTSALLKSSKQPVTFAAATVIPANRKTTLAGKIEQPVSFAVSPYLALATLPVPSSDLQEKILLTHAELICLDPAGNNLKVIAGQLFTADSSTLSRVELVTQWATETADRLAGDSTIALARVRHISEAKVGDEQFVRVKYEFLVLPHQPLRALATKRARRIRVDVGTLQYAEGQFGGTAVPELSLPFETAPPQTRSVQPIHSEAKDESFGISGLNLRLQVSEKKKGKVASVKESRRWWSVVSQQVQYGLPEGKRLLPANFRAPAITSLLPTIPDLPLAADAPTPMEEGHSAKINTFQSVLAGSYSCAITGGRVGARFSIHNSILTQTINQPAPLRVSVVASGSVPVQHRMPRPILLPANIDGKQERALQTWVSFFEPAAQLKQTDNPYDTAFFSGTTIDDTTKKKNFVTAGFGMKLISSEQANALIKGRVLDSRDQVRLLTPDDEGRFWFRLEAEPESDFSIDEKGQFKSWQIQLSLVAAGRGLELTPLAQAKTPEGNLIKQLYFSEAKSGENETAKAVMRAFLGDQAHGSQALIEVKAERRDATIKGYKQTLAFPLMFSSSGLPPSSLRPVFTHFEDAEYNRRLSSPTAQGSRTYHPPKAPQITTLRLVADRREYNPTSEINLVVLSNRNSPVKGTIVVNRVDKESGTVNTVKKIPDVLIGVLQTIELEHLASPLLSDNESILLLYKPELDQGQEVQVRVDIVGRPVTPVPEAGFALLRNQQGQGVECRRFAWSPSATRVELIDPGDLGKGLVRRRAVFQWTDTIRSGIVNRYTLQKIKPSGSTHFPSVELL